LEVNLNKYMEEDKIEETVSTPVEEVKKEDTEQKSDEVQPEVLDENKEPVETQPETLEVKTDESVQAGDHFGQ